MKQLVWNQYESGQYSEEAFKLKMMVELGAEDPVILIMANAERMNEIQRVFQMSKKGTGEDEIKLIIVVEEDEEVDLGERYDGKVIIRTRLANGQLRRIQRQPKEKTGYSADSGHVTEQTLKPKHDLDMSSLTKQLEGFTVHQEDQSRGDDKIDTESKINPPANYQVGGETIGSPKMISSGTASATGDFASPINKPVLHGAPQSTRMKVMTSTPAAHTQLQRSVPADITMATAETTVVRNDRYRGPEFQNFRQNQTMSMFEWSNSDVDLDNYSPRPTDNFVTARSITGVGEGNHMLNPRPSDGENEHGDFIDDEMFKQNHRSIPTVDQETGNNPQQVTFMVQHRPYQQMNTNEDVATRNQELHERSYPTQRHKQVNQHDVAGVPNGQPGTWRDGYHDDWLGEAAGRSKGHEPYGGPHIQRRGRNQHNGQYECLMNGREDGNDAEYWKRMSNESNANRDNGHFPGSRRSKPALRLGSVISMPSFDLEAEDIIESLYRVKEIGFDDREVILAFLNENSELRDLWLTLDPVERSSLPHFAKILRQRNPMTAGRAAQAWSKIRQKENEDDYSNYLEIPFLLIKIPLKRN